MGFGLGVGGVAARLSVVGEESLAEQRQDDLCLARAYLGEVKALLRADDPLQECFLLRGRHDLVPAVGEALIARELLAEHLDEGS